MADDSTRNRIAALDRFLDRERSLLLEGDLAGLVARLAEKSALIDALADCPADKGDALAGLRAKVLRNQELLDKALQGLRSAARRMSALHRARRQLDTYDSDGRKCTIVDPPRHKMEKRA